MVQQLTNHEREAHREEFPIDLRGGGFRVRLYLDRENQASTEARERSIRYRAHEAAWRAVEVNA